MIAGMLGLQNGAMLNLWLGSESKEDSAKAVVGLRATYKPQAASTLRIQYRRKIYKGVTYDDSDDRLGFCGIPFSTLSKVQ